MQRRAPKLIVGLGNVLCRDDGVGVRVVERLAAMPLPPDVELFEAGTAGLSLASIIEHRQRVVVADAVEAGLKPGAILRLTPAQLGSCATRALSLHQVHLLDVLDETRLLGTSPAQVVVIAVQIGDVSTGIGLTPAVERSVQPAVELVLQELALGGCDVRVGPAQACDSVSFAPSAGSVSLEGAPWN